MLIFWWIPLILFFGEHLTISWLKIQSFSFHYFPAFVYSLRNYENYVVKLFYKYSNKRSFQSAVILIFRLLNSIRIIRCRTMLRARTVWWTRTGVCTKRRTTARPAPATRTRWPFASSGIRLRPQSSSTRRIPFSFQVLLCYFCWISWCCPAWVRLKIKWCAEYAPLSHNSYFHFPFVRLFHAKISKTNQNINKEKKIL